MAIRLLWPSLIDLVCARHDQLRLIDVVAWYCVSMRVRVLYLFYCRLIHKMNRFGFLGHTHIYKHRHLSQATREEKKHDYCLQFGAFHQNIYDSFCCLCSMPLLFHTVDRATIDDGLISTSSRWLHRCDHVVAGDVTYHFLNTQKPKFMFSTLDHLEHCYLFWVIWNFDFDSFLEKWTVSENFHPKWKTLLSFSMHFIPNEICLFHFPFVFDHFSSCEGFFAVFLDWKLFRSFFFLTNSAKYSWSVKIRFSLVMVAM